MSSFRSGVEDGAAQSSSCEPSAHGSSPPSAIALCSLSGASTRGPSVLIGMLLLRRLMLVVACASAATRVALSAAAQIVAF
jgi:hypothetical protein